MLRNALNSALTCFRVFLLQAIALVVGLFLIYFLMMHVFVPALANAFARMGK